MTAAPKGAAPVPVAKDLAQQAGLWGHNEGREPLDRDGAQQHVIGHDLNQTWPTPSGWRALCECGEQFRGIREQHALDRWHAHWDQERENAGLGEK